MKPCHNRHTNQISPRLGSTARCMYIIIMDDVYIAIAYVTCTDDQLTLATEVIRYIAAVGTDYPPPLVLNLDPEGPQRFLEMYVQCVGTAIVISFFNKVADDWITKGSAVQVRLPSA